MTIYQNKVINSLFFTIFCGFYCKKFFVTILQKNIKNFLKKYQKTLALLKWLCYYDRAREGRVPIFLCPDASRYAMTREVAAL